MSKFDPAKIRLADGSIAFDCAKLAELPVEGVRVADYTNHVFIIQTRNTKYVLTQVQGRMRGQAFKEDGSQPRYLANEEIIHFHGCTYGGSMIRIGFIGVDMHLEFSTKDSGPITTSAIQSVQVAPLEEKKSDYLPMESFAR